MNNRVIEFFCMPIFVGMFFSLTACKNDGRDKLTIAVSANMQYAMEELVQSFTESSGIQCELIVGSSGKLTAQIVEGAPFDLFLSADMKYPEVIYEKGLAHKKPEVYAYGYLVFWSLDKGMELSAESLSGDKVNHIAIANPETAPYGAAALDLLRRMGIIDQVHEKLVYGESVSQTNQFILSGSVQVGITARSVVSSPAAQGKGHWTEADDRLYQPIAQGVVVLKNQEARLRQALAFSEFLRSSAAKEILHKFGYGLEDGI